MYNNFSSKKTKKVISALLASALVVTSAPITANAATVKKVGVGKTITYNAKATVKSVKSSKKGIVKATKKGKKVTIKGVKAGTTTVTVKTSKKTVKLNVKVGATKIAKKTLKTTMTAGTSQTVSVTATAGKGDTIKFASSNKAVLTVNKASAKASAKGIAKMGIKAVKEGTATLTVSSKNTGVKKAFKITVKAAAPAATNAPTVATTPGITTPTATVAATKAPSVATTPAVQTTAPTTTDTAATENPDATKDPNATVDPNATKDPSATVDPNATKDPNTTQNPETTDAPSVSTNPAVTASPSAIEFTAKQTGEKKFVITNPTAMKKTDISITRGTSAVTIDNIQLNEDATVATVTLAGSIVETTYTVKVGDATTTFTGESSVVKDIQITSQYAPIKGELGADPAKDPNSVKATATYAVYNQFGEDVTAKTSLTANTSAKDVALNPTDGTMTITWEAAPRLNDVVSVVLMHQATGLSTSKILTVQTKAAPAEIEVKGIYNTDGKTLTATNVTKESFYFLYRVKDQYGNYMTANQVTGDNMFITVSSGMTNVTLDTDSRQTVTVDGVNYFAYPVDKKESTKAANAGSVTVMLIPGGSGKTVTTEFKVESGSTVKTFNVVVDSAVAKGGKKNLTYVALDENGDEVTDYRVLKEVKTGNEKFYWEKANGKVNLVFNDAKKTPSTAGSTVSAVFTLPSYETRLVTVNIGEASVPASVAGIDSEVALATRKNATDTSTNKVTIPFDKLSIYDQYGNKANTSGFATTAAGATTGQLAIMLVAEDSNNDIFENTVINGQYDDKNVSVIGSSEAFNIVANDEDMLGTESFTLKIVKKGATKWEDYESDYTTTSKVNFTQTGAFTTTLTVTEDERFKSYEVNTIDKMYDTDDTDYEKEITVYGVINTGAKVKLTAGTDFKVVPGENLIAGSDASKLATNYGNIKYLQDQHTTTGKYQVIINYKGDTIDRTTTICDNKPVTASLELDNDLTGINIAENNFNLSASADARTLLADIKGKDTYGETITINKTSDVGTVTFKDSSATAQDIIITASDIDTEDGKVSNNGTKTPKFTGFVAGDSFTVTFAAGDAKFSTVVSIQEATGATSDVDATAPTAQVDPSSSVSQLVLDFGETLYDADGTEITSAPTIGDLFTLTMNSAYTTCGYAANKITLNTIGTAQAGETIVLKPNTLFDAAGNAVESVTFTYNAVAKTWVTDTTAPTVQLKDNTTTLSVKLEFNEDLYYVNSGTLTAVSNGDAKAAIDSAFTVTATADGEDVSAIAYDATNKTVTLTLIVDTSYASGDTLVIEANSLYDASGNPVATKTFTIDSDNVTWK